jgi:DNA repair exonuclease SbcCD ATPase subunit
MTDYTEQKPADGGTTPAPAPTPEDESKAKLRAQLGEYGKTIKELQSKLDTYTSTEKAAQDEEAKKRGEYEKLIADRNAKLSEMAATVQAKERALVAAEAKALLTGLNKLELTGALATMPSDITHESVTEWVQQFKTENADLFAEQRTAGVGSGASGEPYRGAPTNDLKSRLASASPSIRKAAAAEEAMAIATGKLMPGWDK